MSLTSGRSGVGEEGHGGREDEAGDGGAGTAKPHQKADVGSEALAALRAARIAFIHEALAKGTMTIDELEARARSHAHHRGGNRAGGTRDESSPSRSRSSQVRWGAGAEDGAVALPITRFAGAIVETVAGSQVVVVCGETGSGKSTQLPQFLAYGPPCSPASSRGRRGGHGNRIRPLAGRVACTQPRRVATVSVATRVAAERHVPLGREVGYTIRFDDRSSPQTVIRYMTDGMLLREYMQDPLLRRYEAIIVDEAHERSVQTDLLLGLLRGLVASAQRPRLRIVIISATLDADKFVQYFRPAVAAAAAKKAGKPSPDAHPDPEPNSGRGALSGAQRGGGSRSGPEGVPVFRVPGRRHPITIYHAAAPQANYLDAAVLTVLQIHVAAELPGDILVFLTGEAEIVRCLELLERALDVLVGHVAELLVLPLYAGLSQREQLAVFAATPSGARKVVVATNIAETSLTIPGVRHVVDSGFVKQAYHDARTGFQSLRVVPISRAGADQRAGRAGREAPGQCFRLYTRAAYLALEPQPVPELLRTSLTDVFLFLKAIGYSDPTRFPFLDPVAAARCARAEEDLLLLGATASPASTAAAPSAGGGKRVGVLTPLGHQMAAFPLSPALARTLIASAAAQSTPEVLTVVSVLSLGGGSGGGGGGGSMSPWLWPRHDPGRSEAERSRLLFCDPTGDHLSLLRLMSSWLVLAPAARAGWARAHWVRARALTQACSVRRQLERLAQRVLRLRPEQTRQRPWSGQPDQTSAAAILKPFFAGFFACVVRLYAVDLAAQPTPSGADSGAASASRPHRQGPAARAVPRITYQRVFAPHATVRLHPRSALQWRAMALPESAQPPPPQFLLYHSLLSTTHDFMRAVTSVDRAWVARLRQDLLRINSPAAKAIAPADLPAAARSDLPERSQDGHPPS